MRKITDIILHCTATRPDWLQLAGIDAQFTAVDNWHRFNRGWSGGFGYHLLIGRKGEYKKGRDLARVGAHVRGMNTNSIGICLVGGHGSAATDNIEDHFTAPQILTLQSVLSKLQEQFPGARISGHNQHAAKACPGFFVPDWLSSIAAPPQAPDAAPACPVVQAVHKIKRRRRRRRKAA